MTGIQKCQLLLGDSTFIPKLDQNKIIRSSPFYSCRQTFPTLKYFHHEYIFKGLGNPFHSHLQNYLTLAPHEGISRELVNFIKQCVKYYFEKRKEKQLLKDVLQGCESYPLYREMAELVERMIREKDEVSAGSFPQTMELLKLSYPIDYSFHLNKIFLINLKKYHILTREQKIKRITQLANKLEKSFQITLNVDHQSQKVVLNIRNYFKVCRVATLQEVVRPTQTNKSPKIVLLQEDLLEEACYSVFKQMYEFVNLTCSTYCIQEKNYFKARPDNVLFFVKKETPFYIEPTEQIMSLDLLPCFLAQMGLQQQPLSIQQLILKTTPSHLRNYDLLRNIQGSKKVSESNIILSWILLQDYVWKKFVEGGVPILELQVDSETVLKNLRQKEDKSWSDFVKLQVALYESYSMGDVESYDLMHWQIFLSEMQIPKVELQYMSSNRFCEARLVLESIQSLFHKEGKDGSLKHLIQSNQFIKEMSQASRHFLLYLLIKYQQLQLEEILLQSGYKGENLDRIESPLMGVVKKIQENLKSYQKRINNYLNSNNEDKSKTFLEGHVQMKNFYQTLAKRKLNHLWNNTSDGNHQIINLTQPQKEKNKILLLIQQLTHYCHQLLFQTTDRQLKSHSNHKQNRLWKYQYLLDQKQKHKNSQVVGFMKIELFMSIYLSYTIQKYSKLKTVESSIEYFSRQNVDSDNQKLKKEFDQIREAIKEFERN